MSLSLVTIDEYTPNLETIVTASSVIVRNHSKSELDQDLSSGMMNLSKQIDTKINKERDELTQDITTQITETQEKIVFAVVRKSTVERGLGWRLKLFQGCAFDIW